MFNEKLVHDNKLVQNFRYVARKREEETSTYSFRLPKKKKKYIRRKIKFSFTIR